MSNVLRPARNIEGVEALCGIRLGVCPEGAGPERDDNARQAGCVGLDPDLETYRETWDRQIFAFATEFSKLDI